MVLCWKAQHWSLKHGSNTQTPKGPQPPRKLSLCDPSPGDQYSYGECKHSLLAYPHTTPPRKTPNRYLGRCHQDDYTHQLIGQDQPLAAHSIQTWTLSRGPHSCCILVEQPHNDQINVHRLIGHHDYTWWSTKSAQIWITNLNENKRQKLQAEYKQTRQT